MLTSSAAILYKPSHPPACPAPWGSRLQFLTTTRGRIFPQLVPSFPVQDNRESKQDLRQPSPQLRGIIPKIKSALCHQLSLAHCSWCSHLTPWLPQPGCWDDRQTPTSHRPARLAGKTQRKEVRERSKETQGWAGNRALSACKCWGSAGVAGWAQRWEKKIKMGGSLPAAANCKWTLEAAACANS